MLIGNFNLPCIICVLLNRLIRLNIAIGYDFRLDHYMEDGHMAHLKLSSIY